MTWNKIYPTLDGDTISTSVAQIRANWEALASVLSAEHAAIATATSGTHLYGRVSAMLSGTYAEINALSSPGSGALAWDTSCGVCRIYNGTTWPRVTGAEFSRIEMSTIVPQSMPSPVAGVLQWTAVSSYETEPYDSLSERISGNMYVTITADGYYYICGTIVWPWGITENYQKKAGIFVGLVAPSSSNTQYGKEDYICQVSDILNLSAGDTIYLAGCHNHTFPVDIKQASLIITRLS